MRRSTNPYKTIMPLYLSRESQIEHNLNLILSRVRGMENGIRSGKFPNVPAYFRRMLNRSLRTKEQRALKKINLGIDAEFPVFKRNAKWQYY